MGAKRPKFLVSIYFSYNTAGPNGLAFFEKTHGYPGGNMGKSNQSLTKIPRAMRAMINKGKYRQIKSVKRKYLRH